MDKEKEIEEMASDIENICAVADDSCREKQCSSCMAKFLIEAGYRKADEVQKEIVDSILTDIRSEMTVAMFSFKPELKMDLMTILLRLERDYGVEVDE